MGSPLWSRMGGKSGADASRFRGTGINFSYGKPKKFTKDSRAKNGAVKIIVPPNPPNQSSTKSEGE